MVPMLAAQDHKRLGEGDTGPNTGGMGAYAPAPLATPALRYAIMRDVLHPAIEGLSRVGSPFFGVLYAGIMVKDGTPYVLEFNARFGDPETQVVLPLLKTDLRRRPGSGCGTSIGSDPSRVVRGIGGVCRHGVGRVPGQVRERPADHRAPGCFCSRPCLGLSRRDSLERSGRRHGRGPGVGGDGSWIFPQGRA